MMVQIFSVYEHGIRARRTHLDQIEDILKKCQVKSTKKNAMCDETEASAGGERYLSGTGRQV